MSSSSTSPRIVLVTGSNTGIGLELVKLLAARGDIVYLSSRNVEAGLAAQKQIKEESGFEVKYVHLDVTVEDSVLAAKATIEKNEGKLDVLVNNAAIAESVGKPSELPASAYTQSMEVNFYGVIRVATTFLPLIRKSSNRGIIVNVTSELGSHASQVQPNRYPAIFGVYYASKVAMNAFTISLAKELKDEGIRVNAVTPGLAVTKLSRNSGSRTPKEAAEVLYEWVSLDDQDDRTGLFVGYKNAEGTAGELEW
ncbi:hypothetical protein V5O48_004931 [Marasmius crinis-equi]|uniref:NAD(P)-binding protein n=1 Tax=Marasmius crinis-equi TaxID=585013 RepID=A0ABR3FNP3_9AGAR